MPTTLIDIAGATDGRRLLETVASEYALELQAHSRWAECPYLPWPELPAHYGVDRQQIGIYAGWLAIGWGYGAETIVSVTGTQRVGRVAAAIAAWCRRLREAMPGMVAAYARLRPLELALDEGAQRASEMGIDACVGRYRLSPYGTWWLGDDRVSARDVAIALGDQAIELIAQLDPAGELAALVEHARAQLQRGPALLIGYRVRPWRWALLRAGEAHSVIIGPDGVLGEEVIV